MVHITLVNDGDCWICSKYATYITLKKEHTLDIKNARENAPLVADLLEKGFDINQWMIAIIDETIYQGVDAARELDLLSQHRYWYQRAIQNIVHSWLMLGFFYPLAGRMRKKLLRRNNKSSYISTIHPPSKKHARTSSEKFWLVLWGGSAKWVIHIGVIQYLIEKKRFPQEIVGTSMGAIIGAAFSLWIDANYMHQMIKDFSLLEFADFHRGEGLFKGNKVYEYLDTLFAHSTFDDCVIPLRIVSTDIETGETVVHSSGSIAAAVRASLSLPGVFAPVDIDGRLLVDGGLTSNLPIDACQQDTLIAVSTTWWVIESQPSNTKGFSRNSIAQYFHTNKRILSKSITLLIKQNEELSLALSDAAITLLRPNLSGYDFVDFKKYEALISIWYKEAELVLSQTT